MRLRIAALATSATILLVSGDALANVYSCCTLGVSDGACTSQEAPCTLGQWGAELERWWAVYRDDGWVVDGNVPPWEVCLTACPPFMVPDCPPAIQCASPGWQWDPTPVAGE
jgi:hypothetical protein